MRYRSPGAKNFIFACALCAVMLLISACGAASQAGSGYTGMDYLTAGDYSTAVKVYRSAIEENPEALNIEDDYRGLGIALMGLGQYEDAAAALETSLKNAGPVPADREFDINYYLGTCYMKLGELDKALAVYDAITTLRPKDTFARVCRGYVKAILAKLGAHSQLEAVVVATLMGLLRAGRDA